MSAKLESSPGWKGEYLLPIELLFNLLAVCRGGTKQTAAQLRTALRARGLQYGHLADLPRLSFWIRLARDLDLLEPGHPPRATWLAANWFGLPPFAQLRALVEAWQVAPASPKHRSSRRKLLACLRDGIPFPASLAIQLTGPRALGIYRDGGMTPLGHAILQHNLAFFPQSTAQAWQIAGRTLYVPYPPDWALLWRLEAYLEPAAPGVYPLDPAALQQAAQRGPISAFLDVCTQGLNQTPPDWLPKDFQRQPVIRVRRGVILEFEASPELQKLRRSRRLRQVLRPLLSPRHVLLAPETAPGVLRRLVRRGLLDETEVAEYSSAHAEPEAGALGLSRSERAYLLNLLLVAGGLELPPAAPPGLLEKLRRSLPPRLRGAAARQAHRVLVARQAFRERSAGAEPPPPPGEALIAKLEAAAERGEVIDVRYQKTAAHAPEHRRLTPKLVERRGLRYYLIAYCHTRRAERTFRLDRLELLPGPPPLENQLMSRDEED
jgi:hypothetical protein